MVIDMIKPILVHKFMNLKQRLSRLYLTFITREKSFLEIARYINLLGYKTKRGAAFEHRTIRYILQNPFYKGYVRWNRQHHDDHTIKEQSEWIIAKGQHKAIISESLFDETQNQIHRRTLPYKSRAASCASHWLSGMIKCSSCGASLVVKTNDIISAANIIKALALIITPFQLKY